MDAEKDMNMLCEDFSRIRKVLQEGHQVTPDEYNLVKVMIESLFFDLERNRRREDLALLNKVHSAH